MIEANVPVNDLKRHNSVVAKDIACAIERVLSRGWYILGPEVEAFEAEFADFCGAKYAVGVANGTDALELALRALDLPPGAEVATVANAGMYSTTAIRAAGCVPVYIDIDPKLMTMSPASLAGRLDINIKAIIVTHLYGRMAPMPELTEITSALGIPVVEDCAQAHGAASASRKAGSWGTLGCFSFYPTKNLGGVGDAGAVVTSDPDIGGRLRMLRQYGWSSKYKSSVAGGRNSRLDEIQAAVLRAKLPRVAGWNARRLSIARFYSAALADCDLVAPSVPNDGSYVAHLYVIQTRYRDRLQPALKRRGISSEIHYPVPDHRQRCAAGLPFRAAVLETTERCCSEVLTMPCFPEMTDAEAEAVVAAVVDSSRREHA